jgi:hypothetical protein
VREVFEKGKERKKERGKEKRKDHFIGFPGLLSCSHYHVQILMQTPTPAKKQKAKETRRASA